MEQIQHSAIQRTKNHLAYKLGLAMIAYGKNTGGGYRNSFLSFLLQFCKKNFLILLFSLINITLKHKKQKKFYKQIIQMFPHLKYTSLEQCQDYKESLIIKYHLATLLGEALIKAHTTWYKGGYFFLYKDLAKAKEFFTLHKTYEQKLSQYGCAYVFIERKYLKIWLEFFHILEKEELESIIKHVYFTNDLRKNVSFFIEHKKEILTWLISKEFKEKYIQSKHPYPPLLNPDTFNDTKEKLNYTTVNADIAWSLNMPLPRRYDAIIIRFVVSGFIALVVFLRKCGASVLELKNTRQSYEDIYKFLQKSHCNFIVHFDFLHTLNFAYLDSKVPVLMLLRDPISRLRTVVNHGQQKQKNDVFDINEAIHLAVDRISYEGFDIPNVNILENDLRYIVRLWPYNKILEGLSDSSFIHYIDMNEITQKRAFQTLKTLANRFHFPPPEEKDRKFFESKIVDKYSHLLPIYFKINDNTKLFVHRRIFAPKEQIDILSELKINDLNLELGFFAKADEIENFKDNENLLCKINEYLQALKEKTENIVKNRVNEEQVLSYLAQNKDLAMIYKNHFDEGLKHIKKTRPDIVKTWKYYLEFEKMFHS